MFSNSYLVVVAVFFYVVPTAHAESIFSVDTQYQKRFILTDDTGATNLANARLKITIYVYDGVLVDTNAVQLKVIYIDRPLVGLPYSTVFSGAELKAALARYHGVNGKFNPKDHEAGYYFVWEIDLNGDSQFCPGDLMMDSDRSDDFYPVIGDIFNHTLTVGFTSVKGQTCNPF